MAEHLVGARPSFGRRRAVAALLGWGVLALTACGGGAGTAPPATASGPQDPSVSSATPAPAAAPGTRDPSDPSLEVDPQVCQAHADCVVGTPADCCTSFCPEDARAWSRARWQEYQDMCAVVECSAMESGACLPPEQAGPRRVAVCERERCVLRAVASAPGG